MMVPYGLRLLCICLATFFVVNAFFSLLVSAGARGAIRIAKTMRARSATRFLLLLRFLPPAASLAAVLAFCIPSYLWLEPDSVAERIGWVCFVFVLLALVGGFLALWRGMRAMTISLSLHEKWRRRGRPEVLEGNHAKALVIEREAPLLALAGVFRPQLVISDSVLRALSTEELTAVLGHEDSHRFSQDNLKRLLLLLAPVAIPLLPGISLLERTWTELSEWAADDEAVQGDANRALVLASALLRVARLGAAPRLSVLHSSLVASEHDLSARVDRLLHVERRVTEPKGKYARIAICSCFVVCAVLVATGPATLTLIHGLLEMFLR